jgi:hypothetical protein
MFEDEGVCQKARCSCERRNECGKKNFSHIHPFLKKIFLSYLLLNKDSCQFLCEYKKGVDRCIYPREAVHA